MNNNDIIIVCLSILILKLITKSIKYLVPIKRPNGKSGGMPSFIAAFVTFISLYMLLNVSNINYKGYISILIFFIGTLSSKYIMKEHSFIQLLYGCLIGILYTIIIYNYLNNK